MALVISEKDIVFIDLGELKVLGAVCINKKIEGDI